MNRICVFAGSNPGNRDTYSEAARALGTEIAHQGLTELRIVGSLHERKAVMSALSDAVVALPGGCGTLDELFEAITWSQLGLHEKPIGLFDVDGYYAPLLGVLEQMTSEGFVHPRLQLVRATTAGQLLDQLMSAPSAAHGMGPAPRP